MDKAWWRRRARVRRSAVPVDHRAFCRTLARFVESVVDRERRVVVYLAMGDEVDLGSLVAASDDPAARFSVTRTPAEGFELTVHPWGCEMEQHPYGYTQPVAHASRIEMADIGAFLVPGLAFDRHGTRLGRGKGYYDRLLARAPQALKVAITGDYLVEQLPFDDYDVVMTHLAFSTGVVSVPLAPSPRR
jgi:5-formyltetrahydrofolate cyclo-ligase